MPKKVPMIITPWYEHQFWVEVLEDHSNMMTDFLSSKEQKLIQLAQRYNVAFQIIRNKLNRLDRNLPASSIEMIQIAKEIHPLATGYYQYEGNLLNLRIRNQVNINISPGFFKQHHT
ncbi:DUF2935 domain-containing protein [Effusibacillus consociatus]|uniref:DUF2935 domain-containing protein n=1 Tax=Effusibacillus consociatus TaxID=1117041 RepID=A0ABV9Q2G2_9BACL